MKQPTAHRFDYADSVAFHVKAMRLPDPVREFRFHPTRRWRFDLAWPQALVALEIHGGEFIQGKHNRGLGMAKDFEKLNTAQLDGWLVLHCTGAQVRSGYALTLLTELFTEGPRLAGRNQQPRGAK